MKSSRFMVPVVLMSLSAVAFAQSAAHKMDAANTPAARSAAQVSFEIMKTLAGNGKAR